MKIIVQQETMTIEKGEKQLEMARRADDGICPLDLMEAAIASCAATFLQSIWEKRRKRVKTSVETKRTSGTIQLHFSLQSDELTDEEADKYVALIERYCPVWKMVSNDVVIEKTWAIVQNKEPLL